AGRAAERGVAFDEAGAADRGFQGAEPLATRVIRVASERQIGDFAGSTPGAADQMAVREDAHADAGAERDKGEGAGLAAVAAPMLPDRGKVDVALDGDVDAESCAQCGLHVEAIEPGDIGRDHNAARGRLDDAGTPHHTAPPALRTYARARKQ